MIILKVILALYTILLISGVLVNIVKRETTIADVLTLIYLVMIFIILVWR